MCGGFTCSKNALIALNILYVVSSNNNNNKDTKAIAKTRKLRCIYTKKDNKKSWNCIQIRHLAVHFPFEYI